MIYKQTLKSGKEKVPPDAELYVTLLPTVVVNAEHLQMFNLKTHVSSETVEDDKNFVMKGFTDDINKVRFVWLTIFMLDCEYIINIFISFSLVM